MTDMILTSNMRASLSSLRMISGQMSKVQDRLSTGLKVNSAIDNASSFYQARSLANRAADLEALLDSMGQGIQTINAAMEGLESSRAFLEQMESVVEQAMAQAISNMPGAPKVTLGYDTRTLYSGRKNTQVILSELGNKALAAYAADQFYAPGVSKNNEYFGQHKWYLPAVGEWYDLWIDDPAQGIDASRDLKILNNSLAKLGDDAQQIWNFMATSTEKNSTDSWFVYPSYSDINNASNGCHAVRVFQHLTNFFDPSSDQAAPKLGDVIYSDLSYGSANDYATAKAAGKIAVGMVTWVSEDSKDVKLVNLKDLAFSSTDQINNFNPDNPYSGTNDQTLWSTSDTVNINISGLEDQNVNQSELRTALNATHTYVQDNADDADKGTSLAVAHQKQFNIALNEYDNLIRDASYQGINLLKGGRLNVTLNETLAHRFGVEGKDISGSSIGINAAQWEEISDIENTLNEIKTAISTLRDFSSELGNTYQIIQTRQDFTDTLINVLEAGADGLTLADMNEESAQYLALQTRQQLAINSLSLAASSTQSILKLF